MLDSTPQFLHPVALRSECSAPEAGLIHSTVVQQAAHQASVELRASTSTGNDQSFHFHTSIPPETSTCSLVYGLQHPPHYSYPTHPDNPRVKLLTAKQYSDLQAQELALNTPESVLFPWLHGADQRGTAQAMYFGYANQPCKTPCFRGLTTVSCDSDHSFYRPHARLHSAKSLGSASYCSASSISSISSSSSDGSFFDDNSSDDGSYERHSPVGSDRSGPEARPAQLISSFVQEDLLLPSEPARFQRLAVPPQINLRNFRIQAAKLASISDIVLYSVDGIDSQDALPTAERFLQAHDDMRKVRLCDADTADDLIEYNVFIVVDRFDTFERRFPDLVAVTSNGYRRNKVDFFEREREEMRILTQASPIADGVWLGNTQDVPLPRGGIDHAANDLDALAAALDHPNLDLRSLQIGRSRMVSSDSSSSFDRDEMEDGNPHAFSICIEAHDQAIMPCPDALKHYDNLLDKALQVKSKLDAGEQQSTVDPAQIVHLECISTGQACVQPGAMVSYIENIIHLIMWIRRQVKPAACSSPAPVPTSSFPSNPLRSRKNKAERQQSQARHPRNVLIHTADGYTDTSVLALSYIMYDRACTLPQAYLHLQNDRERSFFVYPADIATLGRIETRIMTIIAEERRVAEPTAEMEIDLPAPPAEKLGMFRGRFSRSSTPNSAVPQLRIVAPSPTSVADRLIAAPFFYSERFDGSFPSRILPFLYLGNLNHASNALMLKELGITHVVSIGESALTPPRSGCSSPLGLPLNIKARVPTNSLWLEHSLGNIDVLDLKGISDDGIDSIRSYLTQSEEFIESARRSGGKVLVHCRVGVSRSASLVIAYVMKHLALDLQSAYLLVRSRRLNILIQPTVLFMWSLQWFEAKLNQERAEAGQRQLGTRLNWGYLAKAMTELNQRYLNC